jgi:hypothetical protein
VLPARRAEGKSMQIPQVSEWFVVVVALWLVIEIIRANYVPVGYRIALIIQVSSFLVVYALTGLSIISMFWKAFFLRLSICFFLGTLATLLHICSKSIREALRAWKSTGKP